MKIKFLIIFSLICFVSFGQSKIASEEIIIYNDSIELPGSLTYIKSAKEQPLLIWVHGSGNVDRNGNQSGVNIQANYIKQFRDSVNNYHTAFFSYDKRTANVKNFKYLANISFEDLVLDVQKVIAHFKNDLRFSEIILVGHSQGSLVAMLAVNEYVDKYISIAGASDSADMVIIKQISAQNEEFGKITKQHVDELKTTGTIKEVNPMLAALFAKQNHKFLKSYFQYIPSEKIKELRIPILIINGDKDIQVSIEDANILHNSNSTSRLKIIKNMNHVLKNIDKDEDNLKSYYSPDYQMSEELIKTIIAFIKE